VANLERWVANREMMAKGRLVARVRWVAKLVARLIATADHWVRRHKQRSGQHTLSRQ
jgi:hypothetical protein